MYTSTRLGLDVIQATDAVEAYPAANQQAMGILDTAVTITEGTASSRPSSGSYYGQTYYATDTTAYSIWNGSAWYPVFVPGAWQPLTLSTTNDIGSEYSPNYTPSARFVGDIVQLKGTMVNNSGGNLTNTPWATLPSSAFWPAQVLQFTILLNESTVSHVNVQPAGSITVYGTAQSGSTVSLDGFFYSLT